MVCPQLFNLRLCYLYFPKETISQGKEGTWVNFCRKRAAGLSEPQPHCSIYLSQLQTPSSFYKERTKLQGYCEIWFQI